MTYPLESTIDYRVAALIVMAAFYVIYFGKMLLQRRQGIRTHQIGVRREKSIHRVETLMSIATFGIVPVQLVAILAELNLMLPGGRFTGLCLAVLGDLIFLISVRAMRDSWRAGIPQDEHTELIRGGIYRYSRNPAFLGFDLMYIGVLLMFFHPLTLAFTAFAIVMLHLQILQEERYLTASFGSEYSTYKRQVRRYLGRRSG